MSDFLTHYNYWIVVLLMMIGFYIVIAANNLIKKVIGLNVFQTSVFLLYISLGKVTGGATPIITDQLKENTIWTNPLPSVLILTAIVVGIATTALALALIVRIREEYGTVEEDEIHDLDRGED